MQVVRIIPKLEVKGENLIKGMHLEGLRIVGKPEEMAFQYYRDGVDELIYIDLVASLYQRENFFNIVERTAQKVFIPLTVGGGIRSFEDAKHILRVGADKVAINTAIIKNPNLISDVANAFGSQCMVVSMEVQKKMDGTYECYTDCGRTPTGVSPEQWAKESVRRGAGEILLTSINQDGTLKGPDVELVQKVSSVVSVPVIASGGVGTPEDVYNAITKGGTTSVAIAAMFHFKKYTVGDVKKYLEFKKIPVRRIMHG